MNRISTLSSNEYSLFGFDRKRENFVEQSITGYISTQYYAGSACNGTMTYSYGYQNGMCITMNNESFIANIDDGIFFETLHA